MLHVSAISYTTTPKLSAGKHRFTITLNYEYVVA
jgi:hypothetical protein